MIDLLELAHAIAEVAGWTEEADTARRLMDQVDRLLTELGLPPVPTDECLALQ
jgi:hypothetical protein